MGTIALPIPWADYHRAGHPWAFSFEQPDPCPFCGTSRAAQKQIDAERRAEFEREIAKRKAEPSPVVSR